MCIIVVELLDVNFFLKKLYLIFIFGIRYFIMLVNYYMFLKVVELFDKFLIS